MIDFERIVGFDWDGGNPRKSEAQHNVSQAEAEQVFFAEPLIILADPGHGASEERFYALGHTFNGRRLFVSFTLRGNGTLIRVISARDMSRKERSRYGEEA